MKWLLILGAAGAGHYLWTTKQSPNQVVARAKSLLPKTKRFVWQTFDRGATRVCWDSKNAEYVDDDVCSLE